jgi:hypothetical protein
MEAQRERGRDLMLRLAVRKRIDQSTDSTERRMGQQKYCNGGE